MSYNYNLLSTSNDRRKIKALIESMESEGQILNRLQITFE